jgi:hypothetical protein
MKNNLVSIAWAIALLTGISSVTYSQESLQGKLKEHVYTLASDSLKGRQAGSSAGRQAAEYIIKQWKEIGIPPINGNEYLFPFRDKYNNIVGFIEGSDEALKNEYVVIGAHYDHLGVKTRAGETVIYNGADDNASGVAAVTELGRILKGMQPKLKRSVIIVAFDAEEIGLFGSTEFARNPPVPLESIKIMMSIDMVGWHKASGYVKYTGAATLKNGKAIILKKTEIPAGLNVKTQSTERSVLTATDTEGFAKRGVPTLAVTTGLKSPYHKPTDDAELIDYDGLEKITEHLAGLTLTLSQEETLQPSGKFAFKHKEPKVSFGITAMNGYNHHYYTEGALDGKVDDAWGLSFSANVNFGALALRPELEYNYLRAKHPAGMVETYGATVPVNLVLQTVPNTARLSMFIGPYYSYKFAGTQAGAALDFKNTYNRNEVGINMGFGLRVTQIRITIVQRMGLTDFSRVKNADGANVQNRTSWFTIGYEF